MIYLLGEQRLVPEEELLFLREAIACLRKVNSPTDFVVSEVKIERARQNKKWGQQDLQPAAWLAVLGEEYGEVCRAVCEGDTKGYREELVQVAAVAVQMIECLDRNGAQHDRD